MFACLFKGDSLEIEFFKEGFLVKLRRKSKGKQRGWTKPACCNEPREMNTVMIKKGNYGTQKKKLAS